MVDVWFGKTKSPYKEIPLSEMSNEMQTFVKEHYPDRPIKAYDIGVVEGRYPVHISELPTDHQFAGTYLSSPSV